MRQVSVRGALLSPTPAGRAAAARPLDGNRGQTMRHSPPTAIAPAKMADRRLSAAACAYPRSGGCDFLPLSGLAFTTLTAGEDGRDSYWEALGPANFRG